MKNLLFTAFCATILIACNKTTDGNKGVISKEISENQTTATTAKTENPIAGELKKGIAGDELANPTFSYRGLDGSRAKVTFNNSEKQKTLTIESGNGKKFELDKKSSGLYERRGIKVVMKMDSLFITQDGNSIPLVLDK